MTETEFKKLIMPLHKKLYACAFAILKNESDAADCIQDAFTRLWENRGRITELENVAGYATVCVRNIAINMATRKPPGRNSSLADLPDIPDYSSSPSAEMETGDSVRLINSMLASLSPQQRQVMELSSIAELSNTEISRATGLSDENVRVLLSRARKKLKSLFSSKKSLL
ncbi:MAG: sigma-70 family RNA polymerase sigma factor [Muribaculaceae bacterium]|nr:sigma-70 family RNA polymerase sigma factor [Muribaculaceae bacterium]